MNNSIQYLTIENINLATYLVFLGFNLNILPPLSGSRALFKFMLTPELTKAVISYEQGEDQAKGLLDTRGRLYREASAVVDRNRKGGRQL